MPVTETINRVLTRQNGPTIDRPYLKSTVDYTVTATLPDDGSRIDCTVRINNVDFTFDPDPNASGFINIHTLAIGVPYLEPKSYVGQFGYNDWGTSFGQVVDYYSAYPNFSNDVIWGIGASDQTNAIQYRLGLGVGGTKSWTIPLTSNDWNPDGSLKEKVLIGNAQRGINDGSYPSNPLNQPIVTSYLADSVSLSDFDWNYFPMAIRKSSDWESLNRSGGSLQIRKNSSWRDCKNNVMVASDNTVHIRKNAAWERAALTGNNG